MEEIQLYGGRSMVYRGIGKLGGGNLQVQSSRDARGKPLMRVQVVRVVRRV